MQHRNDEIILDLNSRGEIEKKWEMKIEIILRESLKFFIERDSSNLLN